MYINKGLFLLLTILMIGSCGSSSKLVSKSTLIGTWQFDPNREDAAWEQNECSIKSGMRFDENLTIESRSFKNNGGECVLTKKTTDKYTISGNMLTFIYPKMASDGGDLLMTFKILVLDAERLRIETYSEKDGNKAANIFKSKDNLTDDYIRVKE
ncbi:lipocalin family protein [Flavobacterium sp. '19STA2R22 D10 B1']|uniref:lipocalin family protein n=1 Tax=Flavobacterium aerium TaxID=3037261 RepID=UPI00278C7FBA|nr:lipocalin family protein [Flavobacterium sp. '19STA2R22 D10 B1']